MMQQSQLNSWNQIRICNIANSISWSILNYNTWCKIVIRTDTKKIGQRQKWLLINIFHFSSDFDESWWDCSTDEYYNVTNFHQNWMKNRNLLLNACFWLCPIFFCIRPYYQRFQNSTWTVPCHKNNVTLILQYYNHLQYEHISFWVLLLILEFWECQISVLKSIF